MRGLIRHEYIYSQSWTFINCLLIYRMPYTSYRFDDAMFLEPGNSVSYTDHIQLTMYYNWL